MAEPTVIPSKYEMMPDEVSLWMNTPPSGAAGDPSVARTVFPGTSPPADPGPMRLPDVPPEVMQELTRRLRLQQGHSPAVAPPAPGLFSRENFDALLARLKAGGAVERGIGRAAETMPPTFSKQVQEGQAGLQGGLQSLRDQPSLPGPDEPMGPTPNVGALGQAGLGALQIAAAPSSAAAGGLSQLPVTLGEEITGHPRTPEVEALRQVGEFGAGLAIPMTLGGGKLLGPVAREIEQGLARVRGSEAGIARIASNPFGRAIREQLSRPDVSRMRQLYEEGLRLGGSIWYHGFGDVIRRIHGDEAPMYASVVASLSPLREAGALKATSAKRLGPDIASRLSEITPEDIHSSSNLLMANKVWAAWKSGGIEAVDRVLGKEQARMMRELGEEGLGVMKSTRENVLKALSGQEIGDEGALKIRAFRDALLGDPNAIVLDTWMKKIFYPLDPEDPANLIPRFRQKPGTWTGTATPLREEGKVIPGYERVGRMRPDEDMSLALKEYSAFTPKQYGEVSDIIKKFADEVGSTPRDVQAALWVAQKYLEQGEKALAGSMPFQDSLKIVHHFLGQDLSAFNPQVATTFAVAGMVLGSGVLGSMREPLPSETAAMPGGL